MAGAIDQARAAIRAGYRADEGVVLQQLMAAHGLDGATRLAAHQRATSLVESIRHHADPGLMEVLLAEYGLSTEEGIALMCLAEALLRVPDAATMDALIEDKIVPSAWGEHLGQSSSHLVNAATWGLLLTGKVLDEGKGMAALLRGAIKRVGEPVIRTAVRRAMKEMGNQFVLGETIAEALKRGRGPAGKGYTFSYDMLGEAALTQADADAYRDGYANAIAALAKHSQGADVRANPGISVKLSALHPRYELAQRDRVLTELVPRVLALAEQAAAAGMGFNIDAEEADRLDLSLDVIEAVLRSPRLAGWDGFGVVVQAYGKRAALVLDWLYALATDLDRRLMVRLVKGAYWDTEIKRAQVEGLSDFPVFTQKASTDVSYLACARKLLAMTDRIYPQFATHNAHSMAAILALGADPACYEFQRLHGMGESLHDRVLTDHPGVRCRIYAPVGAHRDLLAYLVRRLLENGANSSFVNQIVNHDVPASTVAADPFAHHALGRTNDRVAAPSQLFWPHRANAAGYDLTDTVALDRLQAARAPFQHQRWEAGPMLAAALPASAEPPALLTNPSTAGEVVGAVRWATPAMVQAAFDGATPWTATAAERARVLVRAAALYEQHHGELFALLAQEAGKTPRDAVAELREAVDFLHYYAAEAIKLSAPPRGIVTCISPWNFPLAIFTGQIAAALAAGNAVLAKPAEATPLVAHRAGQLLHEAGVPRAALQLLPGQGGTVGAAMVADPRVGGVAFTGSTATAQAIHRGIAEYAAPDTALIAETGGLNAMIVDSTALPEQAIRDILVSAFQSAGQRCSALRVLYLQQDIAEPFLAMLFGAMDQLTLGDPWSLSTDVGPVIDARAKAGIEAHIQAAVAEGRLLKQLAAPADGTFFGPAVIKINGIGELAREIFGPVLHVATFAAKDLDHVIADINATGFGLTFGIHSRIDSRVQEVVGQVQVGNLYVNRNQIGAIVGSQPFGGQGLSGTGPKAGGPRYLPHFTRVRAGQALGPTPAEAPVAVADRIDVAALQALINTATAEVVRVEVLDLPGPTGESNRLATVPRGVVLCLGPDAISAAEQARQAAAAGCPAVRVAPGVSGPGALAATLAADQLTALNGFAAVVSWDADPARLRTLRQALAARSGALIPLLTAADLGPRLVHERHVCIDTTAAGGNARLLAVVG